MRHTAATDLFVPASVLLEIEVTGVGQGG